MNRAISILALSAVIAASACAQTLNVNLGNITYAFPAEQTGVMPYTGGSQLTVMGKSFSLSEITSMTVTNTQAPADNTVTVDYNGATARVTIAANIANYVTGSVSGADVILDQSAEVSDAVGEITYRLAGTSANGSLVLNGSYKTSVELAGLTLTSKSGPAIDIQNGKRVAFRVADGTVNTLTDAANGSHKACLYVKGHLEFKQKGTLNVTGNTGHAIFSKEYMQIKNTRINVLGAVKDGLNCNQYFLMESGTVDIKNVHDDGIQVSFKDDANREAEDTGTFAIEDGTITVAVTATAAKAIKADGNMVIDGGTITASTTGGGMWDADAGKTKGASCLSADGDININDGTLTLKSTGAGGKGISCDGVYTSTGGTINVSTTGGVYVYYNNKEYQGNYTGNLDNLNSKYKSSPKGIKCDGNVNIDGGTYNVSTIGKGAEGIETKKVMTITDGNLKVRAYDDALNSSSTMYIKGGYLDVIATNNDGLDSNGDMYISGGTVLAFGGSSPECGIDVNSEQGYTLYITGGNVLGVGGNNSTPTKTGSTQPYVSASVTATAGSTISIGTTSVTYFTFEIPADYKSSSSGAWFAGPGGMGSSGGGCLISVPQLVSGTSYTIKSGNSSATATAQLTGSSSGGRW